MGLKNVMESCNMEKPIIMVHIDGWIRIRGDH